MGNVSENITSYNSVFCAAFAMAAVQHFCKISKTTSAVTILTSGCLNAGGAFLVSKSPIQDKYKFVLTISVVALGSISSCGLEKISKKFSISKTANRTLSLSLVSSAFVGHVLEKKTQRVVERQREQTLRAASSTSAPERKKTQRVVERQREQTLRAASSTSAPERKKTQRVVERQREQTLRAASSTSAPERKKTQRYDRATERANTPCCKQHFCT